MTWRGGYGRDYIGAARAELGRQAEAVWQEGREVAFDDAVALALKLE